MPEQAPAACRLEREVLGGRLWHAGCQALNRDLPAAVPISYGSAAEYVATFEPLLFEEAREAVRSDWAEAAEAARQRVWPASVLRCRCACRSDRGPAWQPGSFLLDHARVLQLPLPPSRAAASRSVSGDMHS